MKRSLLLASVLVLGGFSAQGISKVDPDFEPYGGLFDCLTRIKSAGLPGAYELEEVDAGTFLVQDRYKGDRSAPHIRFLTTKTVSFLPPATILTHLGEPVYPRNSHFTLRSGFPLLQTPVQIDILDGEVEKDGVASGFYKPVEGLINTELQPMKADDGGLNKTKPTILREFINMKTEVLSAKEIFRFPKKLRTVGSDSDVSVFLAVVERVAKATKASKDSKKIKEFDQVCKPEMIAPRKPEEPVLAPEEKTNGAPAAQVPDQESGP